MSIGSELNSISIAYPIKGISTSPATSASKLENVEKDAVPLSLVLRGGTREEFFFRRPGKNHLNPKRITVLVQYSLDLVLNVFEVKEMSVCWQIDAEVGVEVIM